jgi:hypothetical protein
MLAPTFGLDKQGEVICAFLNARENQLSKSPYAGSGAGLQPSLITGLEMSKLPENWMIYV